MMVRAVLNPCIGGRHTLVREVGAPLRSVNDTKSWTLFHERINHFFYIEIEKSGIYRVSPIMIDPGQKSIHDQEQESLNAPE